MKILSQSKALKHLEKVKSLYRNEIATKYEPRAKNCTTCEVQGSCCLDEHFVNVNISRLEAVAVIQELEKLGEQKQERIFEQVEKTVEKYGLSETDETFTKTYSCPFFEKGTGCLIHGVKPVPCIQHACYEKREDLPPDELQMQVESEIEYLNSQAYRQNFTQLPLPLWISKLKQLVA